MLASRKYDLFCLGLIAAVCVVSGVLTLRGWDGPAYTLSNELYVPAALFAQGRGFVNPPLDEAPGLRDFLYLQPGHAYWNGAALPDTFSTTALDTYQQYHRYLVYAMGFIWRIFGVSWGSAKVLAILLYVAAIFAAYALFRMAMRARLALAGALIVALSPITTGILFNIRDYSKAPFITATMALLLWLVTRRVTPRQLLFIALSLGMLSGVGVGFRRDLLITLPPALLLLAICPGGPMPMRARLFALAGCASTFLVCAAPILGAFADRGSAVYHDSIMGMATVLEDDLGITPAGYERVPVKHDFFVTGIANTYARRMAGEGNGHYDNIFVQHDPDERKLFIFSALRTFPADFILRCYAAALRAAQGVSAHPWWHVDLWGWHLAWLGPIYVLVAASAMALTHRWRAFAVMLVLLYFGGITSLQYEWRHAVHLYCIPVGACLLVWRGIWLWPGIRPVALVKGAAFAVGFLCLLLVPWLLALPWQAWQLRHIRNTLREARTAPVPCVQREVEGWVYLVPVGPIPMAIPDPANGESFFRPLYLRLELEGPPVPVDILSQSQMGRQEFGRVMRPAPASLHESRRAIFMNFPEFDGNALWVHFAGVGVPAEHAGVRKGLSVVTEPGPISIHPDIVVTASGGESCYQGLQYTAPSWRRAVPPPPSPVYLAMRAIYAALDSGNTTEARARIDAALQWGIMREALHVAVARVELREGNPAAAEAALRRGLAEMPGTPSLLRELEALSSQTGAP